MKSESKQLGKSLKNIIYTSLFAALVFVSTAYIMHIPTTIGGYIHLGDGFIYLAAALLPMPYSLLVGAIGASLADFASGAPLWIPATFIIKALCAACFSAKTKKIVCARNIIGAFLAVLVNAAGYYLFASLVISKNFAAPLAEIPFNLLQGGFGVLIFLAVGLVFDHTPAILRLTGRNVQKTEPTEKAEDSSTQQK